MCPKLRRYSSFNCLMLFYKTVGPVSSLRQNDILGCKPLVFLFISLSTSILLRYSSISLSFPLSSFSLRLISFYLAHHQLLLELSYISLLTSFIFQLWIYYISLPLDYSHFLCLTCSYYFYCCRRSFQCQFYMFLRRSCDQDQLIFLYLSQYSWISCLSLLLYLSSISLSFLRSLASTYSSLFFSLSKSCKPLFFSSLNSFSLAQSFEISYCMYFYLSLASCSYILFCPIFDTLYYYSCLPLLRNYYYALSRALILESNFMLAEDSSLSSSFLSFLTLSCISQYSFILLIYRVLSYSFFANSSSCNFLSCSISRLCISCSSLSIFSVICLWRASCSQSIFLSQLVSATQFICFTQCAYLFICMVWSKRGDAVGGVTNTFGEGLGRILKGSWSSFALLTSATEATDLFYSFLLLTTERLSSFLREIGGFILPCAAGGTISSSSCQQLSFSLAFFYYFTVYLGQYFISFTYLLQGGGDGLRGSILGSGFSCYFLSKSSKDSTYFLGYLFISRRLATGGFSCTTGLGETIFSMDLVELFLSKLLLLDVGRGLLKVGTQAFSSRTSSSSISQDQYMKSPLGVLLYTNRLYQNY